MLPAGGGGGGRGEMPCCLQGGGRRCWRSWEGKGMMALASSLRQAGGQAETGRTSYTRPCAFSDAPCCNMYAANALLPFHAPPPSTLSLSSLSHPAPSSAPRPASLSTAADVTAAAAGSRPGTWRWRPGPASPRHTRRVHACWAATPGGRAGEEGGRVTSQAGGERRAGGGRGTLTGCLYASVQVGGPPPPPHSTPLNPHTCCSSITKMPGCTRSMVAATPHLHTSILPHPSHTCCSSMTKMPGCTRSMVAATAAGPSLTVKCARKETKPRTNFWVRLVCNRLRGARRRGRTGGAEGV